MVGNHHFHPLKHGCLEFQVNITAESAFWTKALWTLRAFSVRTRFFQVLRKPFKNESLNANGMLFWTLWLRKISISQKIKTIAHFEDFHISIYQLREHLPPLGIFVRGTRNPNQKSEWWTNHLRNNFDCVNQCETPLVFEWDLSPNWSIYSHFWKESWWPKMW